MQISRDVQKILITFISIYRYLLSCLIGHCCRFEPSCSVFAIEAIKRQGSFFGCCLALRRVLCCHPWHAGGLDPVPGEKITLRKINANFRNFLFKLKN